MKYFLTMFLTFAKRWNLTKVKTPKTKALGQFPNKITLFFTKLRCSAHSREWKDLGRLFLLLKGRYKQFVTLAFFSQKHSTQKADWILVQAPATVLPVLRFILAFGGHDDQVFDAGISLQCQNCGVEQTLKSFDIKCECDEVDVQGYLLNLVGDLNVKLGKVKDFEEKIDYSVNDIAWLFMECKDGNVETESMVLLAEYVVSKHGPEEIVAPFREAQLSFKDFVAKVKCPPSLCSQQDIFQWLLKEDKLDLCCDLDEISRGYYALMVCSSPFAKTCFDASVKDGTWFRSKLLMEALYWDRYKEKINVEWYPKRDSQCLLYQRESDGIIVKLVKEEKLVHVEHDLYSLQAGEKVVKAKKKKVNLEPFRRDWKRMLFGLCKGDKVEYGGNFAAIGYGTIWVNGEKCFVLKVQSKKFPVSPVIAPESTLSTIKSFTKWLNSNLGFDAECVVDRAGFLLCELLTKECLEGQVFTCVNCIGTNDDVFVLANDIQWKRPSGTLTNWKKSGFIVDCNIKPIVSQLVEPSLDSLKAIHTWIDRDWGGFNSTQAIFAFGFGLMSAFRSEIIESVGTKDFPCCWMYSANGGAGKSTVSRMVLSLFGMQGHVVSEITEAKVFEKLGSMRDCLVVIDDFAIVTEVKLRKKILTDLYELLHRIHDGRGKDSLRGSSSVLSNVMFCTNVPPPSEVQLRRMLLIEFCVRPQKPNVTLDRLNLILQGSYHALPILMQRVSYNSAQVARIQKLFVDPQTSVHESVKASCALWVYFTMEYARVVLELTEEDVWKLYCKDILKIRKEEHVPIAQVEAIVVNCIDVEALAQTKGEEWKPVQLVEVNSSNGIRYWSVKQLEELDSQFKIHDIARALNKGRLIENLQKDCITLIGKNAVVPLVEKNLVKEGSTTAKLCRAEVLLGFVKKK